MNFFPFTFSFEPYVAEYIADFMKQVKSPTATVALHKDLPSSLVQKINDDLSAHNLPLLANINAWKKQPGEVQVMHADLYVWDKINGKDARVVANKAAFNIPVCNTKGSRMVWYSGAHSLVRKKVVTPSGTHATYFDVLWEEDYKEEEELELLSSHFVKTSKPHRVYANLTDTRIIASVRLQGNPSFEKIYDILHSK